MSLGLLGAFAGGVLTLLSPCSAMLLPAFFSYAFTSPKELLGRTFIFYLGLVTTLVPLGILAGSVGAFVTVHRDAVVAIAAVVISIMGVLTALNINLPFMPSGVQSAGRSSASVYLLGAVYGVAGVCAGPILGAVLTVAAASASALWGGLILVFFAAGMAFPLVLLSVLWTRLPVVQRIVRPRPVSFGPITTTWTNLIGGLLMVALAALLFFTSGTAELSGFLGAGAQARIEGWVLQNSSAGVELVILGVIAAVGGLIALFALKNRGKRDE
ncbi:cytochrome c biogenesis CcdA family protein [Brevibacterium sp. Marseille-P9724]|uniref:cytochrome c biogenesis CcdA family protein n=1 Tax=Brevibacterium sp. Marseille-P9724 TaxID=2614125 RepID=UPI00125F6AC4|nr:cytochrome c biogenesis CcdA family protein [Brevibacterium sp. Marseille-P9724]